MIFFIFAFRLYSDYIYFADTGRNISEEDFHNKVVDSVEEFMKCFRKQGIKMCAYDTYIRFHGGRRDVSDH